jgi:hypothetical protein
MDSGGHCELVVQHERKTNALFSGASAWVGAVEHREVREPGTEEDDRAYDASTARALDLATKSSPLLMSEANT